MLHTSHAYTFVPPWQIRKHSHNQGDSKSTLIQAKFLNADFYQELKLGAYRAIPELHPKVTLLANKSWTNWTYHGTSKFVIGSLLGEIARYRANCW